MILFFVILFNCVILCLVDFGLFVSYPFTIFHRNFLRFTNRVDFGLFFLYHKFSNLPPPPHQERKSVLPILALVATRTLPHSRPSKSIWWADMYHIVYIYSDRNKS